MKHSRVSIAGDSVYAVMDSVTLLLHRALLKYALTEENYIFNYHAYNDFFLVLAIFQLYILQN
jgi:hypothetical protein